MKHTWVLILSLFLMFATTDSSQPADLRPDEIVTVLAKDGIQAILSPTFKEGSKSPWVRGEAPVIGVQINGDSRAYPVAILSSREIVNDKVGGIPIAVTW